MGSEGYSYQDVKACIEKRLFIGRLQPAATQGELDEVFGSFGQLSECRLFAEKGIAFVGYTSWASAHKALVANDCQASLPSCNGQPITVCFAERSSGARSGGTPTPSQFTKGLDNSRVFVGGLPEHVTDVDMKGLFGQHGTVDAANLLPAKGNKGRRCGFVNFALWGEALDAIEALDNVHYPGSDGEAMTVVLATPRDEYQSGPKRQRADGLDDMVTQGTPGGSGELQSLKVSYLAAVEGGTDETCDELHNRIMNVRKANQLALSSLALFTGSGLGGLGGVASALASGNLAALSSNPTLSNAIAGLASLVGAPGLLAPSSGLGGALGGLSAQMGGAFMGPGPDSSPPPAALAAGAPAAACEDRDTARLFVGGLPYECTDEELRVLVTQVELAHFPPEKCQLTECRVLPGRGCGYIRFSSWEAATEVLQALDQRAVSGWALPLRVRWATPKAGQPASGFDVGSSFGTAGAYQQQITSSNNGSSNRDFLVNTPEESSVVQQGLDPKRLFVGQLTRDLREQALLESIFHPFGHVESVKWLQDKYVAYVQYASFESSKAAIAGLDGKVFPGISRDQGIKVSLSKLR